MEIKHMSLAKPVDFTELVRGGVFTVMHMGNMLL